MMQQPFLVPTMRTATRHSPPHACYACNAPVPQGWGYCIGCSDSYATHRYNGSIVTPVQPLQEGPPFGYYPHHNQGHIEAPYAVGGIVGLCGVPTERSASGHSQNGGTVSNASIDGDTYSPTVASTGVCACCLKAVDAVRAMPSGTCSKRCDWVSRGCCPQCGRYCMSAPQHLPGQPYCSIACASQSHQANWCPTCGVRQMLVGSTHCSDRCASQASTNFPIRQRKKIEQQNQSLRHEVAGERERHIILQSLRSAIASTGATVANVISCAPHTVRRKQYLTYRSSVEQAMVAAGNAPKYGHGGEGNEQRRYIPLAIHCTLGSAGNSFAPAGTTTNCCDDPQCSTCVVLREGMNMEKLRTASHYCTSDFHFALLHALQLAQRGNALCAVAVCRAVIGTPSFVRDPTEIVPGKGQSHSTIITAPGADVPGRQEGTYLFRDDALEVLQILLFQ